MQTEIMIAGFGGQGVLFSGQLLSYAGMDAGKEVTWIPSYGPEMRGGTANCTIIISDEEIGAPLVRHPGAVIAMNQPSLDKYENQVHPGGVLVVNTSLANRPAARNDIRYVLVPSSAMAENLGDGRLSNMVLLGALLANLEVISQQHLEEALQTHIPTRHKHLLPLNLQALRLGAGYGPATVRNG